MKKSLILFSVAALALVSCAKVTDKYVGAPENNEIALNAFAIPATRSAVSGAQASFPEQSMYVAAYQSLPTTKDYFGTSTGVEFAKNYAGGTAAGSDNLWGAVGTAQYWPLAKATLNFLAVTEGPTGTTRQFGTETAPSSGVYEHFANKVIVDMTDNSTAQHDLMYGYEQSSVTQTGTNGVLSFPTVEMQFHHALAWVNFKVKAADAATASAIAVKNITLNDAVYDGTYTVTMPNYNSTTDNLGTGLTAVWDATAYAAATPASKTVLDSDGTVAINASTFTSVENDSAKKGILVVPNPDNTKASFSDFTVKFTMGGSEYSYTIAPASKILEAGKKYTYAITFTLHEIRIEPTVEAWDVVADRTVAIP